MRYAEFRDKICEELRRVPAGLTWLDVKAQLSLPYNIPCPEWVRQMEREVGLSRERGSGRALIWKFAPEMSRKPKPSKPRSASTR
jgi:hypothetical protein